MNYLKLRTVLMPLILSFILNLSPLLAYGLDNPNSPDLIGQFSEREKPFITNIEKPTNGTRDTIRAYHKYKLFLDKELNQAYSLLLTKLPLKHQEELKASQRHWIKFRDAEFELINSNWTRSNFGSSFVISRGGYSSAIIRNRFIQLLDYAKNY